MTNVKEDRISVGIMCCINDKQNSTYNPKNYEPELRKIFKNMPLTQLVEDVCKKWKVSNPTEYALKLSDKTQTSSKFLMEENKHIISEGSILWLTYSADKTASSILDRLQLGSDTEKEMALSELSNMASDYVFAQHYVDCGGAEKLLELYRRDDMGGKIQSLVYKSIVGVMDHGILDWSVIDESMALTLCSIVTSNSAKGPKINEKTLEHSLDLVESLLTNGSPEISNIVEANLTIRNIAARIPNSTKEVQEKTISVLNALLVKSAPNERSEKASHLLERSFREDIMKLVHRPLSDDMNYQLGVLQRLLLSLVLNDRRMQPFNQSHKEVALCSKVIKDIRKLRANAIATEMDGMNSVGRPKHVEDYRKLGFENCVNPAEDFSEVPPGLLALDCMDYFASSSAKSDAFQKVIMESSARGDEHDCPFAKASIQLTKLLCEILHIGDAADVGDVDFHPMLFSHEKAFQEFYCYCMELLNKTWKEMRAVVNDLHKVLTVVKEQITRALGDKPTKFEQFKERLEYFKYAELTALWQEENKKKEERESQTKPIRELREMLKPEITELVKQQRLNYMVEGTRFIKNNGRRKDKFWYCRLSPNHKALHHGDCEDNVKPSADSLPVKLPVSDIKQLVIGRDSTIQKDRDRKMNKREMNAHVFSLVTNSAEQQQQQTLDFMTSTADEFSMWTDGINVLLSQPMTSQLFHTEFSELLNMEVRLRLLDTQGIAIPDEPPKIPDEPPNLDFLQIS